MTLHCAGRVSCSFANCLSPTADSDGVSAQIGSGVAAAALRNFPRGFRENSARVLQQLRESSGVVRGGFCWRYRLSLFCFMRFSFFLGGGEVRTLKTWVIRSCGKTWKYTVGPFQEESRLSTGVSALPC